MNKFKRAKARQYPAWLQKLQQHLRTLPEQPGHLYRLDFAHQADCAVQSGGRCNCSPCVTVDGHPVSG